jgi:hypothetical protein
MNKTLNQKICGVYDRIRIVIKCTENLLNEIMAKKGPKFGEEMDMGHLETQISMIRK